MNGEHLTHMEPVPPVPLTPSAAGREPVLTLDEMKHHLRIEPEMTDDDDYLVQLERAARLNTESVLRQQITAGVGENVKQALLLFIAHLYRNREAVGHNSQTEMPLAYRHLLSMERDYPVY